MIDARHRRLITPRHPRGPSGATKWNPTLSEALEAIGWMHAPSTFGRRTVINERRTIVGELTVSEVWAILKADRRVRS